MPTFYRSWPYFNAESIYRERFITFCRKGGCESAGSGYRWTNVVADKFLFK